MKCRLKACVTAFLMIIALCMIMFASIHVYCIGWTTTVVVSTESTWTSEHPSLSVGSDGTVHIAWQDESNFGGSGLDKDIFYRKLIGSVWSATEVVSTESTSSSSDPSLSVGSDGVVHIAWMDDTDYGGSGADFDIFYKRFVPGSGWTTTEVVSKQSAYTSDRPSLAIGSDGTVHIAWQDESNFGGSGLDKDIFYRKLVGSVWSATEVVSTESTGTSDSPSLAVGPSGDVRIAWRDNTNYDGSSADWDIFYKTKPNGGVWTTTEVVSTESTDYSYVPSLCVSGSGKTIIAWEDNTNYDGCGTDADIFFKYKTSGDWSTTEVISTESTSNSYYPSLGVAPDGTVHITWEDRTDYGEAGIDSDIFHKRLEFGVIWTTTEVVSTESTKNSHGPSLDVGSDRTVHITWYDQTNYNGAGTDWDIFYKKLDPEFPGESENFVLLEGEHVNIYVPIEIQGRNFRQILIDFEAIKVCDIAYELLQEIVGWDPFPGEKVTVIAYGYDGDENQPAGAGYARSDTREVIVFYDRLSQTSSLFSLEDIPNFNLIFHELTHMFTPDEFAQVNVPGRHEGLAYFGAVLIYTVILDNAQSYGLSPSNVEKMLLNNESPWVGTVDPSRDIEYSDQALNGGFLYQVANDFEDCGRNVFKMFFKLLHDSNIHIPGVDDNWEIKRNSLYVAMIDSVTNHDYRLLFRYYRFELDDSLYSSYKVTLSSWIKDTFIISMFPTSGYVGKTVNLKGTIETLGGNYWIGFDINNDGGISWSSETVKTGTAPTGSNIMSDSFTVPSCINGLHKVALVDEMTYGTDTIFFNVLADITPSVVYHYVIVDTKTYVIETCSNSTLSDVSFNQASARIRFNVEGFTGTTGFCNITVPAELMSGTFSIYKDDALLVENVDYTETYNGTHYHFSIKYEHSTHIIQIFSTTVIPELSTWIMLLAFTITTLAVIIYGKRPPKKRTG